MRLQSRVSRWGAPSIQLSGQDMLLPRGTKPQGSEDSLCPCGSAGPHTRVPEKPTQGTGGGGAPQVDPSRLHMRFQVRAFLDGGWRMEGQESQLRPGHPWSSRNWDRFAPRCRGGGDSFCPSSPSASLLL